MKLVLNSDTIDSREIECEILELEEYGSAIDDVSEDKLNMLRRVREEVEGYTYGWKYGVTLVHERHWVNYAKDYAYNKDYRNDRLLVENQWPINCIDWDEAAEQLKLHSCFVSIDGETYFYLLD
jgi:hypothetical protein